METLRVMAGEDRILAVARSVKPEPATDCESKALDLTVSRWFRIGNGAIRGRLDRCGRTRRG
jgi:hypothetical protein